MTLETSSPGRWQTVRRSRGARLTFSVIGLFSGIYLLIADVFLYESRPPRWTGILAGIGLIVFGIGTFWLKEDG